MSLTRSFGIEYPENDGTTGNGTTGGGTTDNTDSGNQNQGGNTGGITPNPGSDEG